MGENTSNIIPRIYLDPSINDPQLGLATRAHPSPNHKAWRESVTFKILNFVTIDMRLTDVVYASSAINATKIKTIASSVVTTFFHWPFLHTVKPPLNADDVFRLEQNLSCALCTFFLSLAFNTFCIILHIVEAVTPSFAAISRCVGGLALANYGGHFSANVPRSGILARFCFGRFLVGWNSARRSLEIFIKVAYCANKNSMTHPYKLLLYQATLHFPF